MSDLVNYERSGGVSVVTMDDGKVNVFSIPMLSHLHQAFDQAERDETVVLLTGRPGYFSAGFDLKVFDGPADDTLTMLRLGATLAERILSFPAPVAVACSGHAFPAGAFLLMSADTRVGAEGPYKLGLNEVRIGLTLPWFAIVLARHRLTPSHFDHAVVTGTMLDPPQAREAGLLDAVVRTRRPGRRGPGGGRGPHRRGSAGPCGHQAAGPSESPRGAAGSDRHRALPAGRWVRAAIARHWTRGDHPSHDRTLEGRETPCPQITKPGSPSSDRRPSRSTTSARRST